MILDENYRKSKQKNDLIKKSLAAVKRRGISLVNGLFKLDEPV